MVQIQYKMDSKIGSLYFVASEKGLQGVFWTRQNVCMTTQLRNSSPEVKHLRQAVSEISEYFAGKIKKFDVALDMEGTTFQKKVWKELCKIPYGKTIAYKELAKRVGTLSSRAVGTANAKNPLCVIIPCHRVIRSSGELGGYSGGISIKKRLLALERGVLP